jgi:hypothetical protein
MAVSDKLARLIATAAPLWAGEAEVVRTYWDWPGRNRATDLRWLALQCYKEFRGSGVGEHRNLGVFVGPLTELIESHERIEIDVDRRHVLGLLEGLYEEFSHYVAFAEAHDAIRCPDDAPLDPHATPDFPADAALTALRYRAIAAHGALGVRASKFTEGGYCALFREGMRLEGRGGHDALIAAACATVFEDEFTHMLGGIVGLDDEGLAEDDWRLLETLVGEILRQRILMRNQQFSEPLPAARIAAIFAGEIAPLDFDYDKAAPVMA